MQKISYVRLSDQYVVNMQVVLGKGSTGSVYQGKNVKTNQKVAVKVIELSTITNEVTEYLLKMEKTALMTIDSQHVVKGLRVMQDQKYCFMVIEFCNGGTLKKYIQEKGVLSEEESLIILKGILEGYQNLVQKKVVHRDLKPTNVMMHNESPKIIDFGYCEISGYRKPGLEYNVGSPSYMAPQSYEHNIYNQKTQIWAIGVIFYECLTGKTLDHGRKMKQIFKEIQICGITYPDFVSQKARSIINWCTSNNPANRPSCSQILQKCFPSHPQRQIRNKSSSDIQPVSARERSHTPIGTPRHIQTLKVQKQKQVNMVPHFHQERKPSYSTSQGMGLHRISAPQQLHTPNKYVDNRVRPTFSQYDPQSHIHQKTASFNQPNTVPQINKEMFLSKEVSASTNSSIPNTNEYGLLKKENIVKMHPPHLLQNTMINNNNVPKMQPVKNIIGNFGNNYQTQTHRYHQNVYNNPNAEMDRQRAISFRI